MLKSLVDDNRTDKNTVHSYLDLYETLLSKKKNTATNVLEVGIGDFYGRGNGGSIMLWHNYFQNARVHALDIQPINKIWDEIPVYVETESIEMDFEEYIATESLVTLNELIKEEAEIKLRISKAKEDLMKTFIDKETKGLKIKDVSILNFVIFCFMSYTILYAVTFFDDVGKSLST